MLPLSYSFAPNRTWFVFNLQTGETVERGLKTSRAARMRWIILRGV